MRILFTLALVTIGVSASAQPIIAGGNPLTGINGAIYDSVAGTGTNMHGTVANSKDGKLFSTNGGKLRYINTNDFSVMDSMNINLAYFVGSQSNDSMFGFNNYGNLCRFNTLTKTLIDTVALAGQYHIRVAERPNSKEVWISGFPMHVVDYTNAMTSTTTFTLGSANGSTNINSLKISSDGLTVYAASGVTSRIYLIDAVNKVVTDSIYFASSPTAFELNASNTEMYVAGPGKIYVVETTNYTIIDSANVTMPTTSLYRHPTKPEIWCVHHFRDSVSVFNANSPYNLIDSIPVGGSPFFLAFGVAGTGVSEVNYNESLRLYPNPANGAIYIELSGNEGELELYDGRGAMLRKEKVRGTRKVLPVGELAAGVYIISVKDAEGKRTVGRFNKL